MRILPFRSTTCLIRGDDLVTVSVSGSALGGRVRPGPTITGFLGRPVDELREALRALPSGPLTLVIPSTWCSVRPIALTTAKWAGAEGEIRRNIEGFLPIAASDALVGLMDRVTESQAEEGAAGYLIGAPRSRVEPWRERLEQATGRRVETVLSTHMALLGLGLQHHRRATVIEQTGRTRVAHRLRDGRIEALEARWDPDAANGEVLEMDPGAGGAAHDPRAKRITAQDLAVAGALATQVGAGDLRPLQGRGRSLALPWLVPVAATLLALGIAWTSFRVAEARYVAAADAIRAERAALQEDLHAVADAREEASRLVRSIEEGVNKATAEWRPILPVVHAAQMAVPPRGFLYNLEIQPDRVMVSGEAPDSGDVLQALENDPRFADARQVYAVTIVPERGMEKFDIQARRVDGKKGGVQ